MSSPKNRPPKLLIVDDEPMICEILRKSLSAAGMDVKTVESAESMNRLLMRERFDLILLDLLLPGEDGLSICRRLRGAGDTTPIIMVTGRAEETDRIIGLELGADDYVTKPFSPREIQARIAAVLRRVPKQEHPAAPVGSAEPVRFGPFSFDLAARALFKNGERVVLSSAEFALLKAFVRSPGQPMSREKLAHLAQGRDYHAFDRSLDVRVSRLRRLIEPDMTAPRHIQTVWGVGYMFVPEG